ncbi:hypothetical protein HZA56_21705 [Candidatus Poribacteria bacterium]|nr:hypothetical protein [Candidatus Poribacteria bacterium]
MPKSIPIAVILDADVIIESFRVSAWQALIERATVYVPSVVAYREAQFFVSKRSGTIPIKLSQYAGKGQIRIVEATVGEQQIFLKRYGAVFLRYELHDGEKEALALLYSGRMEGVLFCSGDKAATQALTMVDMRQFGISLGELLERIGYPKPLQRHFTREVFEESLNRGSIFRITGDSLLP